MTTQTSQDATADRTTSARLAEVLSLAEYTTTTVGELRFSRIAEREAPSERLPQFSAYYYTTPGAARAYGWLLPEEEAETVPHLGVGEVPLLVRHAALLLEQDTRLWGWGYLLAPELYAYYIGGTVCEASSARFSVLSAFFEQAYDFWMCDPGGWLGGLVEWETPPVYFIQKAWMCIQQGDADAAERQVDRGLRYHPDSRGLARLKQTLAPPRARYTDVTRTDTAANETWLQERGAAFSGKWVALLHGQLMASGHTFEEVLRQAREAEPRDPPLIIQVP